jgi:hypothetical protein
VTLGLVDLVDLVDLAAVEVTVFVNVRSPLHE